MYLRRNFTAHDRIKVAKNQETITGVAGGSPLLGAKYATMAQRKINYFSGHYVSPPITPFHVLWRTALHQILQQVHCKFISFLHVDDNC